MNGTWTTKTVILGLVSLGLHGIPESEAKGSTVEGVLYFFTTPEAEGGPEGAQRLIAFTKRHPGQVKPRPGLPTRLELFQGPGEWAFLRHYL